MSAPRSVGGLLLGLALTGCFDFGARLAECRDEDGAWVCPRPDGGSVSDAGATADAGGATSDGGQDELAGLACQEGWCWEHPRPGGIELQAVWGRSRDDLWVGGERGFLAHWDGTGWTSASRGHDLTITSICGHGDDVFFGMGTFGSGDSPERVLQLSDGGWNSLGFDQQVTQLTCGTKLFASTWSGASSLDWATFGARELVAPSANQLCTSVLETRAGECLVACRADGTVTPFARIYRCDGTLELERVDDGGQGASFSPSRLWEDPVRGVMLGVMGAQGQVWQRDAGWWTAWASAGANDVYGGAAHATGSLAVGGYGVVVDFVDGGVAQRSTNTPPAGNGYLHAVWSPPSGDAIAVGQWGCILERVNGEWTRRNLCNIGFQAISLTPRPAALGENGVYLRSDAGWSRAAPFTADRYDFAQLPDGGFLTLNGTTLFVGAVQIALGVSDAQGLAVAKERAVVTTRSGGLVTLGLTALTPALLADAGVVGAAVVDDDGTTWVPARGGEVLVSTGGDWTRESTTLGGELTDLAAGFGKVWALSGQTLAWRGVTGGPWQQLTAVSPVSRIVPLSATEVLLLDELGPAWVMGLQGARRSFPPPPDVLVGRIAVKHGEVWGVGVRGGLVRLRLP